MDRPDDISEAVWTGAEDHLRGHSHLLSSTEIVARAVIAERERAAKDVGNFLMLRTPLDVVRIVECEEVIRSGGKQQ
jgi:hypothetical protein